MLRFGFIIPLRPRSESNNWKEDIALLNRTIGSVLQQSYAVLTVYVIYTDVPSELLTDPRVKYIQFPFDFLHWEELPNREELLPKIKFKQKIARRWDKGRKVTYGSGIAKKEGCDYLMSLDSDDLLSKYFLSYLSTRSKDSSKAGWYMDKGYLYKEDSGFFIRVPKHMTGLNGSTHVLRSDLVRIPDFDSADWLDYNQFTDHGWVRGRVKEEYNEELEEVPTYMLVYVVHGSNMSGVYQKEYGFSLKAIVKRILRSVPITKSMREEFHINAKTIKM